MDWAHMLLALAQIVLSAPMVVIQAEIHVSFCLLSDLGKRKTTLTPIMIAAAAAKIIGHLNVFGSGAAPAER